MDSASTSNAGQFYTLLGPSGCGKTSTLRCIAGLETPTSGSIEIDSTVVYASASRTLIPPHKRNIGMVFQSYAIWPHMTVFDNVAFPLVHGARKQPRKIVEDKVMRALALVQLDALASRPAPMLSGGQQQRVALARAIASEPAVLLLDEPLSNLDARLREDMRHEIKTLVRRLETTTLYVTHDQLEALSMSDRVALVNNGAIVQEGAPRDVYLRPADAFAANFLGRTNLLEGRVLDVGRGHRRNAVGDPAVWAAGLGQRRRRGHRRLPARKRHPVQRGRRTGRPARQDRGGQLRRRRRRVPDRPGWSDRARQGPAIRRARGRSRRARPRPARTLLRALRKTTADCCPRRTRSEFGPRPAPASAPTQHTLRQPRFQYQAAPRQAPAR